MGSYKSLGSATVQKEMWERSDRRPEVPAGQVVCVQKSLGAAEQLRLDFIGDGEP